MNNVPDDEIVFFNIHFWNVKIIFYVAQFKIQKVIFVVSIGDEFAHKCLQYRVWLRLSISFLLKAMSFSNSSFLPWNRDIKTHDFVALEYNIIFSVKKCHSISFLYAIIMFNNNKLKFIKESLFLIVVLVAWTIKPAIIFLDKSISGTIRCLK